MIQKTLQALIAAVPLISQRKIVTLELLVRGRHKATHRASQLIGGYLQVLGRVTGLMQANQLGPVLFGKVEGQGDTGKGQGQKTHQYPVDQIAELSELHRQIPCCMLLPDGKSHAGITKRWHLAIIA